MVIAMTGLKVDTDVFVIGGGPAGLAAALAARQRGLSVMVADGGKPPADKACGEGLMPDSLEAARSLGISFAGIPSMPFRGIRFHGKDCMVDSPFPAGSGLGVRRTVLHPALVAQADAAGVDLLWSTPVTGIDGQKVRMGKMEVRARWILGASQHSPLRLSPALRCRALDGSHGDLLGPGLPDLHHSSK
jgi:flavin-dependent dehydrogenase